MHYLEHKKEGKENFMAVKLDMSQAYDWVEWGFIERVMEKMGFHKNYAMYIYCILLCDYQWSSAWVYLSYKRSPTRRPLIPLLVPIMCRGFLIIN